MDWEAIVLRTVLFVLIVGLLIGYQALKKRTVKIVINPVNDREAYEKPKRKVRD